MTLAETASIFSETLVFESALKAARPEAEAARPLLELHLQDACQVIVDILSRFYFERAVFERRASPSSPRRSSASSCSTRRGGPTATASTASVCIPTCGS